MTKETGKEHLYFLDASYPCVYKGGYFSSIIWDKRVCVHRHYAVIVDVEGVFYSMMVFTISKSYEDVVREIEKTIEDLFMKYVG